MLANLLPGFRFLHLDAVVIHVDGIVLSASTKRLTARCPVCGQRSRRVHSRYRRTLADLPLAGKPVVLHLQTRRFYCQRRACPRHIFTERLPDLVAPHGRRSDSLRAALQQIGLRLGGEAGARLAQALGLLTSPDTLLRLVRAAPLPRPESPLRLVGVDEWAWRKGMRYGTVLVDLEAHRVAGLLPDRDADAVAAWFATRPDLEIISRDRAGLYADAATRGAPQAIQVADRFHLARNLGEALEKFLLHKGAPLKAAAAGMAATLDPPTEAAEPTNEMYRGKRRTPQPQAWRQRAEEESLRRHAWHVTAYETVGALHDKGVTIAGIARRVGVSRRTVYRYLHLGAPPERKRPRRRERHVLEPYEPYLLQRWNEGCHNGVRLWREIRAMGFAHSVTVVTRFVTHLRREGTPSRLLGKKRSAYTSVRGPSAREVALLFLRRVATRRPEQGAYVDHLCRIDPEIAAAYALTQDFMHMVRERQGGQLDAWIEEAAGTGIAELGRFAAGLQRDHVAVVAGLTLVHSNGQVEGQITRLKCVRRSMYGRGKFDLLQRRVLCAA